MELINVNDFENYLNMVTFQVSTQTGVTDDEMLGDFRLYLKDYLLGEILSKKEHIDLDCNQEIPLGIMIALTGSGISYGIVPGGLVGVEGFDNNESLYKYAVSEAPKLDVEIGGDNFLNRVFSFVTYSNAGNYKKLVSNFINFEVGIKDRVVGYIKTNKDENTTTFFLAGALYSLGELILDNMEKDGLDSSNSLTYNIMNDVLYSNCHYTLAEKRALIGMVYVDTKAKNGEEVDNDIIAHAILDVEAASYIKNGVVSKYKEQFDKEIKDFYGYGKIIKFPGR